MKPSLQDPDWHHSSGWRWDRRQPQHIFLQHSYMDKIENLHSKSFEPHHIPIIDDDSLYTEYGVVSEWLEQPLEKEHTGPVLHYPALAATPHGRHLLLVSLLESQNRPLWAQRCGGRLQLFLPESLRPADLRPRAG